MMALSASDPELQLQETEPDRRDNLMQSSVRQSTTRSRPTSLASSDTSSLNSFHNSSHTARRTSIFSRMSSSLSNNGALGASGGGGAGGLRDTFFGKSRPDPLEESAHNEFNLTVIDEEGLIAKPHAEIIPPRLQGCCNGMRAWSTAGWFVVGIAVAMVVATFTATMLSPTLDGYEIDPGLVLGSLQTLVLCSIVFITYHGVHIFQAHPNPIILYKCVIDMALAMRFLLDPWLLSLGVYQSGVRESCSFLSGVTQFLYISSDCWYFALIVDLYQSLTNPFTSVQADRKKYILAVGLMGTCSGLLTGSVASFHGFADGNYCWTHRGDSKERNFWRLNVASWIVFYDWMIIFYLAGIAVLVFGVKRLRSGLKLTLDSRREMLRNSAISIMSFTGYWTIAFSLYAISFSARTHYENDGRMSPSKVFRACSYTLAGRGAVDYFVWFMINQPSQMKANWMKFSSESADKKFSAQLNASLQRELIFFTIEGMTKAVQLADEELVAKRERSPTQELVLGGFEEEEVKDGHEDDDRDRTSGVETHLSGAPSDAGSARPPTHPKSGKSAKSSTASSTSSPTRAPVLADGRRSFLSHLGFSRTNEASDSGLPGLKLPLEAMPLPKSTSEQKIKFTPYKSEAFAELRASCGLKTDSFLKSFEASTKPSISEGASGAFMFFSGDKKFIVKSMAESEARFLCDIADDYVEYLTKNPWSLITKFYGCFKITLYEKKFYFVVMENLFDVMEQGVAIHHRYDIKGSWVNRSYSQPRRGAKLKCRHCSMQFQYGVANKRLLQCPNVVGLHEPNVVLKDNDLRTRMRIGSEQGRQLFEHLREDSLFLCGLGIMDYSLLLGVTDIEFLVDPPAPGNTRGGSEQQTGNERRDTVSSHAMLTPSTSSVEGKPRTNTGDSSSHGASFSTLASSNAGGAGAITASASETSGSSGRSAVVRGPTGALDTNGSFQSRSSSSTTHAVAGGASFSARSLGYSHSSSVSVIGDEYSGSSSTSASTRRSTRATSDGLLPPMVPLVAPPRDKKAMRKSERVFGPGFYYIGIIDILQQWSTQKKLERFWKVNVQQCDAHGLSAIDPVSYQRRFEAKLREIIAIPRDGARPRPSLGSLGGAPPTSRPQSPVVMAADSLDQRRRSTGGGGGGGEGEGEGEGGATGGGAAGGDVGRPSGGFGGLAHGADHDHDHLHDHDGDEEDLLDLEQGSGRRAEPILVRINSQQRRLMSVGGSSRSHASVNAV